ncbi:cytochrome P450 [Mangrovimicrobium sediminis]|uniref:Cytochrome P450 n=1 Tax=Mangrovimicrobium sediminis TaxID=2562682 RepID=A0A4Z0LVC2_9GAMM|nr:cytochrome P450 [Haliea sp. SAOS-164]TGD71272.1 cytochrome P450 [Haliea sp. SAOS-164]
MNEVLTARDPLYEELYDVRREAEDAGNLVEGDANPGMNALRDAAPVHKGFLRELLGMPEFHRHSAAKGRQGYTCFSYATCDQAFRDFTNFSNKIMQMGPAEPGEPPRLGLLEMDEPEHRAYRRTIQPKFSRPVAFKWWTELWVQEIVDALMLALKDERSADLNLQLCARIPVHTITRAVGLDGNDALVFRHALMRSSAYGRIGLDEVQRNAATVQNMLTDLVGKRRRERRDDLTSHLVDATLELPDGSSRPLTDAEIVMHLRVVLIAGGGTSWRQMGITLWALLADREQLEIVRADRGMLERAVIESVRWNPTDPVFSRLVAQDCELGGVPLPAGAVLEICLGAANRDPARWDNPDVFDVRRPVQHQLGWGMGTHQCMGMNVAKAEIIAAINGLLDSFPNIRLDPDQPAPFLTGGLEQRGISALPVRLD